MKLLQIVFIALIFVACSTNQNNKPISTTIQVDITQTNDTVLQIKKEKFWQDGFG